MNQTNFERITHLEGECAGTNTPQQAQQRQQRPPTAMQAIGQEHNAVFEQADLIIPRLAAGRDELTALANSVIRDYELPGVHQRNADLLEEAARLITSLRRFHTTRRDRRS